jgi:hypothetical protein
MSTTVINIDYSPPKGIAQKVIKRYYMRHYKTQPHLLNRAQSFRYFEYMKFMKKERFVL